jgi:hypothetical protein
MFGLFKKRPAPPAAIPSFASPEFSRLVPRLRHASSIEGYADTVAKAERQGDELPGELPVFARIDGDLIVSYAFNQPDRFVTVTHADARRLGLSEAQIHATALQNLYACIAGKVAIKKLVLSPPNAPGTDDPAVPFFGYLEVGEDMEASCLLLEPLWRSLADSVAGELCFVVPTPNHCFFCGAADPALVAMQGVADGIRADAGPKALSAMTFTRHDGQMRVMDLSARQLS